MVRPLDRRRPVPRRKRSGFTLVELLVTSACVVLLIGMLMPSLSGAMAASRSLNCQTNLRQLGAAAMSYASVYGGHSPAAILYFKRSAGVEIAAWDFVHHPDGTVTAGALWQFTDAGAPVHQCPDFDGPSTFGSDPYTGYNYNTTYIGAEGAFPQAGPDGTVLDGWTVARRGVPPGAQRRASETALFGDGGWKGGANKFMRAPMNTIEQAIDVVYAGGQAFRHRGSCNLVHLDGHCSSPSRCCPGALATESLLEDVMDHPHNGFLTNDDAAYDPR